MSKKTGKYHKKIKLDIPPGTSFDDLMSTMARTMSKQEQATLKHNLNEKFRQETENDKKSRKSAR